ncbi:MAG: hypothetical protein FWD88_03480, partial [Treponema sp.]|nr:hypothetical protein [Treponema sp.]
MKPSTKTAIAALLMLAAFFASCRQSNDPAQVVPDVPETPGTPTPPDAPNLPRVVIDGRNNPFRVEMFRSVDRTPAHRVGEVLGHAMSGEFTFDAPGGNHWFFPRYHVPVEGIVFQVDPPGGSVEVPIPNQGVATIPVRPLSGLFANDAPLTNDVYLQIVNSDLSIIRLARGAGVVNDTEGSDFVGPGAQGRFRVLPGPALNYSVIAGAHTINMPSGLIFEPGHIYFMRYDGSTVTLARDPVAITLDNATWEGTAWTAAANSAANTTAINFTFAGGTAPELNAGDIAVTDGTGSAIPGALTGSGNSRSLAVAVTRPGTVRVSISRQGIERRWATVTVHPVTWTA